MPASATLLLYTLIANGLDRQCAMAVAASSMLRSVHVSVAANVGDT
jgi:hypothetical protein